MANPEELPTPTPKPASRRERFRQQTRQEIKDAALRQIQDVGSAGGLSVNALAKSLGMAGPSLYRYFVSRDALLTELLVDGFTAIAIAVETAVEASDAKRHDDEAGAATEALRACTHAYRRWALVHPQLYDLLLATPVPGYAAPMEATGPVAARGMLVMVRAVDRLERASRHEHAAVASTPSPSPADPRWQAILQENDLSVEAFITALGLWAHVHGAITLELGGHLGQMVLDPEALYDADVNRLIRNLGGG